MTLKIVLCSDLDRTLIPNGIHKESPQARIVLQRLAKKSKIKLVYVTGRNQRLILEAINEFGLPVPDYAIGDVGTTLYSVANGKWEMSDSWTRQIAEDWKGMSRQDLAGFLEHLDEIRLQEPEKQNRYKLSYYTNAKVDYRRLVDKIRHCLQAKRIAAGVVWSVDEINGLGLIDILPEHANKLHAIKFLLQTRNIPERRAVFAGDSGNDLEALTSGLQAILVKNAAGNLRNKAVAILSRKKMTSHLYLARGDFFGMNGNYTAGVLEGLVHFFPETEQWIKEAIG